MPVVTASTAGVCKTGYEAILPLMCATEGKSQKEKRKLLSLDIHRGVTLLRKTWISLHGSEVSCDRFTVIRELEVD